VATRENAKERGLRKIGCEGMNWFRIMSSGGVLF